MVGHFKHTFEHFKHTYTHFHILFHPHIYQKHSSSSTKHPHPNVSEFEFYNSQILGVFEFYSLKFESVWILHPKISKFGSVKCKHPQTLGGKFQILKRQSVKSKHSQTSEGKF